MNKLISSNFRRFVHMGIFKTFIIIMVLISAVMLISGKQNELCADNDPFSIIVYLTVFISAVLGIFLSHDYTYGTIRNKLIVGHSREKIYIANLIVCTLVYFIFYAIYFIVFFGVGIPLLGLSSEFSVKATLISIAHSLLLAVVNSSIVTFVCMTVKSNIGTVLSFLLNYAFMLLIILSQELSENIAKFVYDFVPIGQAMQLNCHNTFVYPIRLPVYAIIWILISTLGGIAEFKKTDLK